MLCQLAKECPKLLELVLLFTVLLILKSLVLHKMTARTEARLIKLLTFSMSRRDKILDDLLTECIV